MTDGRYIHIYKRKISIDITCVGLASARPNYYVWAYSYNSSIIIIFCQIGTCTIKCVYTHVVEDKHKAIITTPSNINIALCLL